MNEHDVLKKNRNFYIGVGGTVLEGLLSGSLFMLLYSVMQFLWSGQFDMNRVLALTGIIAVVFLLRMKSNCVTTIFLPIGMLTSLLLSKRPYLLI